MRLHRALKVLVVVAGSIPASFLVLMVLARLDVPRVTEASRLLLALNPGAILTLMESARLGALGFAAGVNLPAFDYRATFRLLLTLALPVGLTGLLLLILPGIRKRREETRFSSASLWERFSEWRHERRTRIEARRQREEEREQEKEREKAIERKRREGLTLRDLLHPEELQC